MNKLHTLGTALALATLVTATASEAYAIEYRCKVKHVTMTWAEQTYVQCEDDTNAYTFTIPVASTPETKVDRLAAIERFLSIALAAQLSNRSLLLVAPAGWSCAGGNCNVTAARLLNE